MDNGTETGMHRARRRVKESSGSERAWGVWQGVLVVAIVGLFGAGVAMRDDLIVATAWAQTEAPAAHEKTDERLDHLERPELAIEMSKASDAMSKVQAAADLAHENAADIRVIKNDLGHVKDGQLRLENGLARVLTKLDELNVRRAE